MRKELIERERRREILWKALSPSMVRVSWDTRVAGPESGSRQLPGNVIRKDQEAKLCGVLQMRVNVGHLIGVTEGATGAF